MVTDPLTLPLEVWQEWLILGIIGMIAYMVAFRIVGNLYDGGVISGSAAGSIIHWIIRFLIFTSVWFVTYWVIVIGQWIQAHFLMTLCAIGVIVASVYRILFLARRKVKA